MSWRIATHESHPASIVEVEQRMSVSDVCDAHDMLDALDAANAILRSRE